MSEIGEVFDPAAETMSAAERREVQNQRLREMLRRVSHVPFYQRQWAAHGVAPSDIRSTDDIAKLPLTTKEDLRCEYPLGLLAVPRSEVVRYHGSLGTTGKPTMVAYTAGDLVTWSKLCARFLVSGGLRRHHTVQIAFGYGLFTGGFGLHYGAERVGAAVVPTVAGNAQRQIMLMRDLEVDALVCTPSYALIIAEAIHAARIPPEDLHLKLVFLGGEPWSEQMRETLESLLPVSASNNYGLSEVIGPGVSGECSARRGMHIQEDHVFVECLDPITLQPVTDGTPGELVFTSLTREAMPIVRYRTHDIAMLSHDVCPCGRTTCCMSRVTGRSDDMMIIRGVNVYPSQIEGKAQRVVDERTL